MVGTVLGGLSSPPRHHHAHHTPREGLVWALPLPLCMSWAAPEVSHLTHWAVCSSTEEEWPRTPSPGPPLSLWPPRPHSHTYIQICCFQARQARCAPLCPSMAVTLENKHPALGNHHITPAGLVSHTHPKVGEQGEPHCPSHHHLGIQRGSLRGCPPKVLYACQVGVGEGLPIRAEESPGCT